MTRANDIFKEFVNNIMTPSTKTRTKIKGRTVVLNDEVNKSIILKGYF